MSAMERHDHGIVQLSGDGVLRSLDPNLTVLAYVKLNDHQIQKVIDDYGRDDNLTKVYDGVNGHDVVDLGQLTRSGKDLLPLDFRQYPSAVTKKAAFTNV